MTTVTRARGQRPPAPARTLELRRIAPMSTGWAGNRRRQRGVALPPPPSSSVAKEMDEDATRLATEQCTIHVSTSLLASSRPELSTTERISRDEEDTARIWCAGSRRAVDSPDCSACFIPGMNCIRSTTRTYSYIHSDLRRVHLSSFRLIGRGVCTFVLASRLDDPFKVEGRGRDRRQGDRGEERISRCHGRRWRDDADSIRRSRRSRYWDMLQK